MPQELPLTNLHASAQLVSFLKACALVGMLLLSDPASAQTDAELMALRQRATELQRSGKVAEAIPVLEQLLAGAKSRFGEDSRETVFALSLLAVAHQQASSYAAAEPPLRRALAIMEKIRPAGDADTATAATRAGSQNKSGGHGGTSGEALRSVAP